MSQVVETDFLNLSELTRDEKREVWMKRTSHTLAVLAEKAGVHPSVLSRSFRDETMPYDQWKALTDYGMPEQCLPVGADQKTGPKPKVPAQMTA